MRSKRPTLLFINRVYPPASGASGLMLAEMAESLVEAGWDVTVVTGPAESTPDARMRTAERTEIARCAEHHGVNVVRVPGFSVSQHHIASRLAALILLIVGLFLRALTLGRFDVVVTKSDPPILPVFGALLGFITGAKTVHWAQDVYPEVAEALGILHPGGPAAKVLRGASSMALRKHDRVVTVGRCMLGRMADRCVLPEKLAMIPNWPLEVLRPMTSTQNGFRHRMGWGDRFVVMYSGNLGRASDFDPILDAATHLRGTFPEILFAFVGEGPESGRLRHLVDTRGLQNVHFAPHQSKTVLAESLSAADLHLVTMRRSVRGYVVPSKLYGTMAVGRPCIFLGPMNSEAALVIQERRCGEVVDSASGPHLAASILDWYWDKDRRADAGRRAFEATVGARQSAFESFDELLRDVIGRPHIRHFEGPRAVAAA